MDEKRKHVGKGRSRTSEEVLGRDCSHLVEALQNSALHYHQPIHFRNLTLVPIVRDPAPEKRNYVTSTEAGRKLEVTETGSVPRLRVRNNAAVPVLLPEGEHLMGGYQNRIVTVSILLPPETETEIPVACVEEGRWGSRGRSGRMHEGDFFFAEGRRVAAEAVSKAARWRGTYDTDQGEVWRTVAGKLGRLRAHSETRAMADAYESAEDSLAQFTAALPYQPGQVGLVVAIGTELAGADLFDHPATLRSLYERLLRSYAIDALTRVQRSAPKWTDPASEASSATPKPPVLDATRARRFVESAAEAVLTFHTPVGLGEQARITGDSVTGSALLAFDTVVHLALFNTAYRPQ